MSEYAVLIRVLNSALWGQGLLLGLVAVLYLVSTRYDLGPLSQRDAKRIARLLGLMLGSLAIGQLVGGWTGGTAAYIREYDAPGLGYFVLLDRAVSTALLVMMALTSLKRWFRAEPKGDSDV